MNRLFKKMFVGIEKGFAYVALGNIVYSILSITLWMYLATQLPATQYGEINYLVAIASISVALALLGFDNTLVSYLAKRNIKMESESSVLVAISAVIVSIMLYLLLRSVPLSMLVISMVLFAWVAADALGRQQFKKYMLMVSLQRIISLIAIPFLYVLLSVDGIIYGFAVSYIIFCSTYFRVFKKLDFSVSSITTIRRYFFDSYLISISKTVPLFADKIVILPLFDLLTVGYYQFGAQISSIGSVIPLIMYNYLLPRQSTGNSKNLKHTKYLGISCSIGLTLLLFALIPFIVPVYFPRFEPAIIPAQIIIFSGIPISLSAIYNSNLMASGHSRPVVYGAAIFLIVQFLLISTLGNIYSLIGLSWATVISAVLQTAFLYYSNKEIPRSFHLNSYK